MVNLRVQCNTLTHEQVLCGVNRKNCLKIVQLKVSQTFSVDIHHNIKCQHDDIKLLIIDLQLVIKWKVMHDGSKVITHKKLCE